MGYTQEAFEGWVWVNWSVLIAIFVYFAFFHMKNKIIKKHLTFLLISTLVIFPAFFYLYTIDSTPPFSKKDIFHIYLIFFLMPPNIIFLLCIIVELFYIYRDKIKRIAESLLRVKWISAITKKFYHFIKIFKAAFKEKKTLMYFCFFALITFGIVYTYAYHGRHGNEYAEEDEGFVKKAFQALGGSKKKKDIVEIETEKKQEQEKLKKEEFFSEELF